MPLRLLIKTLVDRKKKLNNYLHNNKLLDKEVDD
jgi:hypothetical protein